MDNPNSSTCDFALVLMHACKNSHGDSTMAARYFVSLAKTTQDPPLHISVDVKQAIVDNYGVDLTPIIAEWDNGIPPNGKIPEDYYPAAWKSDPDHVDPDAPRPDWHLRNRNNKGWLYDFHNKESQAFVDKICNDMTDARASGVSKKKGYIVGLVANSVDNNIKKFHPRRDQPGQPAVQSFNEWAADVVDGNGVPMDASVLDA